ncbi:MAG TPA: acyl-CoA thioesterase [Candidatus Limousia pullorum]|uniref:Acyl-CoA thioesterase n=1 Tax=Candidatus Limousia pullorum TaxID=2840860 RepID=A0A9D1LXI9_9FIRM|nr:acyl-CoA thioesterase [Candidatus Limousia pullorum]
MKISKTELTVRYAETDQMGIVHHSVYPIWYEAGRTDYIKMFGISYTEMEAAGVMMPLINLTCHYGIPAKYEDVVVVETGATKLSAAKMVLYYEVKRKSDGVLLGSGTTEHGFVDSKTFKPINVKKKLPELFAMISNDIKEN